MKLTKLDRFLLPHAPRITGEKESQYVVCGTERAVAQAIALGHSREAIFTTSGMVLNPRFYNSPKLDRSAERLKLGLRPDWPTALVLFGGHGSPAMLKIARALQESAARLQMIFICGHSKKLAADLRRMPATKPMFVEGFTQQVDYYMSLADFFIGKPGPGSIAEALHFGLPVIVECNSRTMPQERYNTQWVRENEAGEIAIYYRGQHLASREVPLPSTAMSRGRGTAPSPAPPSPKATFSTARAQRSPSAHHPWR